MNQPYENMSHKEKLIYLRGNIGYGRAFVLFGILGIVFLPTIILFLLIWSILDILMLFFVIVGVIAFIVSIIGVILGIVAINGNKNLLNNLMVSASV